MTPDQTSLDQPADSGIDGIRIHPRCEQPDQFCAALGGPSDHRIKDSVGEGRDIRPLVRGRQPGSTAHMLLHHLDSGGKLLGLALKIRPLAVDFLNTAIHTLKPTANGCEHDLHIRHQNEPSKTAAGNGTDELEPQQQGRAVLNDCRP